MISLAAFAGKGPKGKLISYSHTQVNPEMPLTSEFSLNWQDGKGILTIYELFLTNENKFTAEVSEDVFRQVTDIIKQKELYAIGKEKKGRQSRCLFPTLVRKSSQSSLRTKASTAMPSL